MELWMMIQCSRVLLPSFLPRDVNELPLIPNWSLGAGNAFRMNQRAVTQQTASALALCFPESYEGMANSQSCKFNIF